ncbi:MAG: pirin-like C-terminal cupin domain-containing protein, partial [Betaproteobacteria bacterium]
MKAGAGIVHEEFHSARYAQLGADFEMIHLWVNLPARDKMARPGYQGITDAQLPRIELADNAGTVRVMAGSFDGKAGPARSFTPMNVWDLRARAGKSLNLALPNGHATALFVLSGALRLPGGQIVQSGELAVMQREGEQLAFEALQDATVLRLKGESILDPIVGYGPFVMHSEPEIRQAMNDYRSGRMGRI